MQANLGAELFLGVTSSHDVIVVGVGVQNIFNFELMCLDPCQDLGHITTRIDQNSLLGFAITQNAAIAPQRPNRKGFKDQLLLCGCGAKIG